MSEFVCLNTFCTFAPTLRKINRGEGGSRILILPQIREVAFQSEANRSHKILGFCHKSFSLLAHMALILKFLDSQ